MEAITRIITVIASRVAETVENSAYLIKAEFILDKEQFIDWLKSQTYTVLYHSQIQIDGIHVFARAEKLYFSGTNSSAKFTEQDAIESLKKAGFEIPADWKEKKAYTRMVLNQLSILKANSKLSKTEESAVELNTDFIYSVEFDALVHPLVPADVPADK